MPPIAKSVAISLAIIANPVSQLSSSENADIKNTIPPPLLTSVGMSIYIWSGYGRGAGVGGVTCITNT